MMICAAPTGFGAAFFVYVIFLCHGKKTIAFFGGL